MKRLLTTTAIGLLFVASPALAQTSQDQTGSSTPQVEQKQPDTSAPSTTTPNNDPAASESGQGQSGSGDLMKSDDTAQSESQSGDDTTAQSESQTGDAYQAASNDFRASNLIGAAVENASGESVGEINDILFDKDGNTTGALIGVGGFLGMGEKNVEIQFSELNFQRNENGKLAVTVAMSTESLEAMPAYKESGQAGTQSDTQTGDQTDPMKKQDRVPAGESSTETAPKSGEKNL